MTCGTKKSKLDSNSDGPGVSDDPQSVSWPQVAVLIGWHGFERQQGKQALFSIVAARVRSTITPWGSERRQSIRWIFLYKK